jgi:hypothetical protein
METLFSNRALCDREIRHRHLDFQPSREISHKAHCTWRLLVLLQSVADETVEVKRVGCAHVKVASVVDLPAASVFHCRQSPGLPPEASAASHRVQPDETVLSTKWH